MTRTSGIIYYHEWDYVPGLPSSPGTLHKRTRAVPRKTASHSRISLLGLGLVALALGGLTGPLTPLLRLEGGYRVLQAKTAVHNLVSRLTGQEPKTAPAVAEAPLVSFNPLTGPDGSVITPVDTEFGLVVPKIGINATVIPAVNPADPGEYEEALKQGVAHASTSYFPDENGTVYLFSHSTSYDWFVKDLNAVFYLVKNLETDDTIVLIYKGKEYAYRITDKKVVSPEAVSYLAPSPGTRTLILQTCWPPGSTTERLLIFADLVPSTSEAI